MRRVDVADVSLAAALGEPYCHPSIPHLPPPLHLKGCLRISIKLQKASCKGPLAFLPPPASSPQTLIRAVRTLQGLTGKRGGNEPDR